MNKEPNITRRGNTESPNSGKVTQSFIDYYEKMYKDLGDKIQDICRKISEIPQHQSIEEDPELELRKILDETSQHQREKDDSELQELAKEAWKQMEKQEQIQKIITRLRFPPEQNLKG